MLNEIEILFPDKELKLSTGESVRVRELSWREALEFIQKLSGHLGKLGASDMAGLISQLSTLVSTVDELALYLAEKSAGMSAEKFGALAARDALAVLDKALEINLNEELLKRGKSIAARFGAAGFKAPAKEA
jgi:hypothetical protein